jgi:hypothetical protein
MFTMLAKYGDKILVGNRRGKVFVTNSNWLHRAAGCWKPARIAFCNPFRIARPQPRNIFAHEDFAEIARVGPKLEYQEIEMKHWIHPGYRLEAWIAFNRYEWEWYILDRAGAPLFYSSPSDAAAHRAAR